MESLRRLLQAGASTLDPDRAVRSFRFFDEDGSGEIDSEEFQAAMRSLGFRCTALQAKQIIASVDLDRSGTIDEQEWLAMLLRVQEDCTEDKKRLQLKLKKDMSALDGAERRLLMQRQQKLRNLRKQTVSQLQGQQELMESRNREEQSNALRLCESIRTAPVRKTRQLLDATQCAHHAALQGRWEDCDEWQRKITEVEARDRFTEERSRERRLNFLNEAMATKQHQRERRLAGKQRATMRALERRADEESRSLQKRMTLIKAKVKTNHCKARHMISQNNHQGVGKLLSTGNRYAEGLSYVDRYQLPSLSAAHDFESQAMSVSAPPRRAVKTTLPTVQKLAPQITRSGSRNVSFDVSPIVSPDLNSMTRTIEFNVGTGVGSTTITS